MGKTDQWIPQYSPWRHGGWYVTNIRYPSGACGCVSNNYQDKKWRIACDDRRTEYTYTTRDEAARAEHQLVKMIALKDVLIEAVESSGFSISGPTDSRAAENGEPAWVCNARSAIAEATVDDLGESQVIDDHEKESAYGFRAKR